MKLVDSSCLICIFNEINRPLILLSWMEMGYKIAITGQVHEELQQNNETKSKVNPQIMEGNIEVKGLISEKEVLNFRNRYPTLGKGEISIILSAIYLNKMKKRYYAVIDDSNARLVAKKYGVNLTGTYGLLKALKEKGHIDDKQFSIYKEELKKSNFRINFNKVK